MKKNSPLKKKLLLIIPLLIISIFLRFYNLGAIPDGLSTDEADLGYNAFSVLTTGKDVYGKTAPTFFQSLDDFKPGLPHYTVLPSIAAFGLTDFSVRLPSAIFGFLIPIITFFLAKLIYPKNKAFPFLTFTLFLFSPWELALSRSMIWYVELIFLYFLAFIFLFLSIRKNFKYFFIFTTLLAITLYVYYASIIYLPFIVLITVILFWNTLYKNLKVTFYAFILLFILSAPALSHYSSKESKTRLNAISIMTPDITLPLSLKETMQDNQDNVPFSFVLHNRRVVFSQAFLANYFNYYNFGYLFLDSKNIRYFYVNGIGLFYLIELPFFLNGLRLMLIKKSKEDMFLFSLLLISPIPASFTLGSPFPHRALLILPIIQFITAFGFTQVLQQKFKLKYPVLSTLFSIYLISIIFFLHQYFIHSPKEFNSESNNGAWFSSVRDVIPVVKENKTKFDKVIFTWSLPKLVPPVYFLFYNKIDPGIIQKKAAKFGNETPRYQQLYSRIENIEFRPLNWESDKNLKNTLFVGYKNEFPKDIETISKTYESDGNEHFLVVANN